MDYLVLYLPLWGGVLFWLFYFAEPRRVVVGLLCNLWLLSCAFALAYLMLSSQSALMRVLVSLAAGLLSLVLAFGVYGLIFFLLRNASIVLRRERRRPANMLTLFLGIGLIVQVILTALQPWLFTSRRYQLAFFAFNVLGVYLLLCSTSFLTASLLNWTYRPRRRLDAVIVLGGGLVDGDRVPPLVRSRVDRAIALYNRQRRRARPPVLLFSGGQGKDETISEARAMQAYAVQKGVLAPDTLVEEQSQNTRENFVYSKAVLERSVGTHAHCAFVTNNFHVLRAGILAKRAGLRARGVAARTAAYYLPNAMIRECIATMALYKKWHLCLLGALAVGCLIGILHM